MSVKAFKSLEEVWSLVDAFFDETVSQEKAFTKPISLRQPFVFYLGHLPAFTANTLFQNVKPRPQTNAYYDDMFSRGIDPDVEDPTKCHDHPIAPPEWPSWTVVIEYRDMVRAHVRECFQQDRLSTRLLVMVAEHDLMHLETLQYMNVQSFRERQVCCSSHQKTPNTKFELKEIEWCQVPPGWTATGCAPEKTVFAWDNEFDEKEQHVPSYRISKYAVTVLEYYDFVRAGGYSQPHHWKSDDWKWVQSEGLHHPASWECDGDVKQGHFRVLTAGNVPWQHVGNLPVSVSLAEARAFAHWRGGYRLPSEVEWVRSAYERVDSHNAVKKPVVMTDVPTSVDKGETSWIGAVGLVGNGWELTDSLFEEFNGFQPMLEYKEYSADFFDGKHFVLKGASWATHPTMVRKSFRNYYQAKYPYVFSKFRLAEDITKVENKNRMD